MGVFELEAVSYPLWKISIEPTHVKSQSVHDITQVKLSQGYKTPCFYSQLSGMLYIWKTDEGSRIGTFWTIYAIRLYSYKN